MPKGKYYEYQIKRSALDEDYLSGNIDDFQYARESLDLDLKYEPYILAQTINSEIAKKQHNIGDNKGTDQSYTSGYSIMIARGILILMKAKPTS